MINDCMNGDIDMVITKSIGSNVPFEGTRCKNGGVSCRS